MRKRLPQRRRALESHDNEKTGPIGMFGMGGVKLTCQAVQNLILGPGSASVSAE
jgi:hypothetical protein